MLVYVGEDLLMDGGSGTSPLQKDNTVGPNA